MGFDLKQLALLFGFLAALTNQTASAQYPQYYTYDDENGLPSNEIYSIVQDTRGFIWLGCDAGLYQFDGVRYTSYKTAAQKSKSIAGLVLSASGRLYCNNFQSQIFYLENDTLRELRHPYSGISGITCTRSGLLLVNHPLGFAVYSEATKSWKNYNRFGGNGVTLLPPFTKCVRVNAGNTAAFLTTTGIGFFSGGQLRVVPDKLFTINHPGNFLLEWYGHEQWIFSYTKSLVYRSKAGKTKAVTSSNLLDALRGKQVTNVKTLSDGNLWICTYNGVIRYHPPTDRVTVFYPQFAFSDCLIDREGSYWFTTLQSGMIRVANMNFIVWNSTNKLLEDNKLTRIAAGGGYIYFAAVNGSIGRLNPQTNELRLFQTGSNADIQCLNYDPLRQCLYFFVNSNLYTLKDNRIRALISTIPPIKNVCRTGNDYFLASSIGCYVADLKHGRMRRKITPNWSRDIAYDAINDRVWVATNEGLLQFRSEKGNWVQSKVLLGDKQVLSIDFDEKKQFLYALTFDGNIVAVSPAGTTNRVRSLPATLQPHQMKYYRKKLYISTNKGVWVFDTANKTMETLTVFSGLASDNVTDLVLSDDCLWLATGKGLQKIPVNDKRSEPVARIYLKGSRAGFSPFHLVYGQSLVLHPEVSAYSSNGHFRYAYRIRGSDDAWTTLPADIEQLNIPHLPAGKFEIELKAIDYSGRDSANVLHLSGYVAPPFWQTWWFIALACLLFFGFVVLVFRYQLAKRQKKLSLENELNTSKLTAIQSQMNPHFIFNSLNSIQDLVLKNDVENSYSYLSTFADLVRKTLRYSDKDFIEFSQEINLIEIYLSLEKLRFKQDLVFTIDTGDVEGILIPPLLIQPFIENALVHGLLHREGEKKLLIRFELREKLHCTIEDNGIGREQARIIRQRQRPKHESFSGKAIKKRFEILSDVFHHTFGYEYEDLTENQEATGTRVTLTIPVKRQF